MLRSAQRQAQCGAHRIVEPLSRIHRRWQMRRIAAQQQHRIETAPACRGEMGELHRAFHRSIAEGIQIELLRQPAPPFGKAETRAVPAQFVGPLREQLQQLLPCRIPGPAFGHAQDVQAAMQRVQPFSE